MNDADVQKYLNSLTNKVRGTKDMPPAKVSTEDLDNLMYLVRTGQLSPKYYEWYRQNSSQSANRAYHLSPTDRESYQKLNPTNAKDAVNTAETYLERGEKVPDHLLGVLNRFYENGKVSQEDYERYLEPESAKARREKKAEPASPAPEAPKAGDPKGGDPKAAPKADGEEAAPAAQDPYVQVNLGLVLKNLHLKAAEEVNKATGGRIQIVNSAYDSQTGGFNTAPGVYSVRASSTRPLDSFGNWFRGKTARKALVMYLNSFLGPELAERFKNASLYQPSTTNKNGETIQKKNGIFGRLKNWATGKSYDQSAAGSKGSVKDVSNKVVSYWMKYKLVNGATNESWIKFAMPGKPLIIESVERPSEANGWAKLTVPRLTESWNSKKTASELFVESAMYDDGQSAAMALKEILEAKLSERFAELDS